MKNVKDKDVYMPHDGNVMICHNCLNMFDYSLMYIYIPCQNSSTKLLLDTIYILYIGYLTIGLIILEVG